VTIVARTSKTLHNAIQSASKEGDVIISRPKVDAEKEFLATADLLGKYAQLNVSEKAALPLHAY